MDFLFDDTIDTTNITNVLLIDKDTLSYDVFYNSCYETTFPIVYSSSCNRNDLLELLSNKFDKIDRLGLVFSFQPNYKFLNDEFLFKHDESIPYSENVIFMIDLINKFNISIVDYLACDTLIYENWKNYYNIISSNTKAIIGASKDRTGNLLYGGNWTMESTGEDIEFIYFNNNIQNYQHLLDRSHSTLLVMNDGSVYGTGYNGEGYLGLGYFVNGVYGLTQMINNTGKTAAAISGGRFHTIVLMTDGTIYGCGESQFGQLGLGPSITTSQYTIAQMINNTGKTPKAISCGERHTIVLMTDGTIYGCGLNGNNQLGFQSSNVFTLAQMPNNTGKTPALITTGWFNTFVLMTDGTLYGAGGATAMGIGSQTYIRGLNLIPNNTGKTPVAISSSKSHTIIVMSDGTIFATGNNNFGQLGTGNTTNQSVFVQMNNTTGKLAIGATTSEDRTHILMSDRTIFGCGFNNQGQLGNATSTVNPVTSLVQLINNTGKTPVSVFAGMSHTIVLMSDGTVFGCGGNGYGELGLSAAVTGRTFLTQMTNTTGLIPIAICDQTSFKNTTSLSSFSIPTKTIGDSPFTITQPTTNSNGSFSYSSSNTSVATISGNTITIVGAGTTTITATQEGTDTYTSATITASFQVNKATSSISGFSISTKTFGDSPFTITDPSSNSNGLFSYTSSNTSVATISGNTITIVGVGTSTITATQAETTNYTSGTITTLFQVNKATPSISGFSIPTKTFGDTPFTITNPSSNSNGSLSYSSSNTSVATISGNTITIVGAGTATITVTQAETTNYSSGTITTSFQVNKATPSITGFSIPTKTYGDSLFKITRPISNSRGLFSFTSSNTSVATINGFTITIVTPGTTTITATQLETTNYSSITLTTSFQVNKAAPTISGFSIPTKTFGDSPFTITDPSSNSDGSFSYVSSDTSVATISGNTITIVSAGTATITATQAETTYYTSGTIIASLEVNKSTPSISNFSIPTKTFHDSPFTITDPSSNSTGSFSYISSDTSVATISGNTITIVGTGTSIIIATQDTTTNYTSGMITSLFQVNQEIQVIKSTPTISGFSIPTKTYGDSPFTITDPSSNSDGSFSYISSDTSVATISGNTITIVGAGTSKIIATQNSTTNYTSGTIIATFNVNKATPSINGFSVETKTYGDSPFTITDPSSNSDGSFNYISSNPFVAIVSGSTITIVGAGTSTIIAIQAPTSLYTSGIITTLFQVNEENQVNKSISGFSIPINMYGDDSSISKSFQYKSFEENKETPVIIGFSIPTKTYGDSAFTITDPTSNSDGSFSYSSSNTSVATINGNTITIVGAGSTTITATQSETTNYNSGTAETSFQVNQSYPTISNFSIPTKTYGDSSFTITDPSSNSDGSFSYVSSDTSVATISGNTITIIGAGSSLIIAIQTETINYTSGAVFASFDVNKLIPSISNFSIETKTYGDSPFTITDPSSNSDGSFNYISSETSVATISGNTITIVGSGSSTIIAIQNSTNNYTSQVITTLFEVDPVNNITPSISDFSIPTKTYGDSAFTITDPSSNSDGSFNYVSSDTSVATISGNTITIVGAGTSTIIAIQTTTTNYTSGTITALFEVNKATPSISNFSIPTKTYGDEPFTITDPSSNSNGSFSYTSSKFSVATISGNTITIVDAGTTTITATQIATTNYTSGTITGSFQVNRLIPIGDICFPAGTPIKTNQGLIPIEVINPNIHTIRNKQIVGITKTICASDKYLVCFEKDSLGNNIPSQKTIISKNHKIFYNGKMIKACELVGLNDKIKKIEYNGEILYNVLMENYDKMMVNNLICETLDPTSIVAEFYKATKNLDGERKIKLTKWYNHEYRKRNKL
jgi:alpha-tubulin suppressor-like RCC1 family protein